VAATNSITRVKVALGAAADAPMIHFHTDGIPSNMYIDAVIHIYFDSGRIVSDGTLLSIFCYNGRRSLLALIHRPIELKITLSIGVCLILREGSDGNLPCLFNCCDSDAHCVANGDYVHCACAHSRSVQFVHTRKR